MSSPPRPPSPPSPASPAARCSSISPTLPTSTPPRSILRSAAPSIASARSTARRRCRAASSCWCRTAPSCSRNGCRCGTSPSACARSRRRSASALTQLRRLLRERLAAWFATELGNLDPAARDLVLDSLDRRLRSRQLDEHARAAPPVADPCVAYLAFHRRGHRAAGAYRSHSPWRWPNTGHQRRSSLPTPTSFVVYPPTQPRAIQKAGRSPSDRPFPLCASVMKPANEKGDVSVAFVRRSRQA